MKRKFKQWWSSILPISTKPIITSHLKWTQKKTTTNDIVNSGPGLGQAQTCGRVKLVNGISTLLKSVFRCLLGLTVIKLSSTSIVLVIEKQPITTLYSINKAFRLDNFEVEVRNLYWKFLWPWGQDYLNISHLF